MNCELQRERLVDARYPIALEVPGEENIRLSREVEATLIRHAANSGFDFKTISTWDDYLFATLVAAQDENEAERMRRSAEELLTKIFSQAQ